MSPVPERFRPQSGLEEIKMKIWGVLGPAVESARALCDADEARVVGFVIEGPSNEQLVHPIIHFESSRAVLPEVVLGGENFSNKCKIVRAIFRPFCTVSWDLKDGEKEEEYEYCSKYCGQLGLFLVITGPNRNEVDKGVVMKGLNEIIDKSEESVAGRVWTAQAILNGLKRASERTRKNW